MVSTYKTFNGTRYTLYDTANTVKTRNRVQRNAKKDYVRVRTVVVKGMSAKFPKKYVVYVNGRR